MSAPSAFGPDVGWGNFAEDRIELVEPDRSWPEQFQSEASAIRSVLSAIAGFRLEHFGSTAVSNLLAKPVIDILLIHPRQEEWPQLVNPLRGLGYVYWAENPRRDRMFFVKGMPPFGTHRTHHVHVRVPEDAQRELLFRDLLRADPTLAARYQRLKQDLAQRHPTDRDAYTDGKNEFVENALGGHAAGF